MDTKQLLEIVRKGDPEVLKRVEKVLKDHDDAAAMASAAGGEGGKSISDRAKVALKAVVRILTPFKDEITDEVLDDTLGAAGFQDR